MNAFAELKPALRLDEALSEAHRCLMCFDAPCTRACPTHIDVPAFIKKIATDNLRGSARTILSANILGASCARVCPTEELCEGACVMNDLHQRPIQIGRLQRYATDGFLDRGELLFSPPAPERQSGRRVAVIGAGPAGLACAVELVRRGHTPIVYDAGPKPGGLNTYGCAEYKITAEFALREAAWVARHGVAIRSGVTVGRDLGVAELEGDHDAVFVGVGLGKIARLGIPGEELPGVWDALDFIARLKTDRGSLDGEFRGRRVVVLGGGNTAIDAVTQAAALGAAEVSLVYRRGPEEMPAYAHEQEHARKLGVRFVFLAAPAKVTDGGGRVGGVVVQRMRLGEPDASGRRRPEAEPGSEHTLPCDVVIKATGQEARRSALGEFPITLDGAGRVVVTDRATMQTTNPRWFAAGDCVSGGQEVVNAVADGKVAAAGIDRYLLTLAPAKERV